MKILLAVITLLVLAFPASACKPTPAPPGVKRHWASPDEARVVAPAIVLGTGSFESDELSQKRGFRFTVERWLKGSGPDIIYVRGPYYSKQSRLPYHSCMIEFPLNSRVVLLLKSVELDGSAVGIHEFDFLKEANLFVRPFWDPDKFGL